MTKDEIKAMLSEAGITVDDTQIAKVEEKIGKTVPYSRFKEKVDDYNSLKVDYDKAVETSKTYTEQIESLSTEKTKLQASINELSAYKSKYSELEKIEQERAKQENTKLMETYEAKMKLFEVKESDSRYNKLTGAKAKLITPNEGETLSIDQIKSNMEKIELLESAGIFEQQEGADIKVPVPTRPVNTDVPISPVQAFASKTNKAN